MRFKHTIVLLLSGWMALGTLCPLLAAQSEQAAASVVSQSPEQLQQLVAPIALYPERTRCTSSRSGDLPDRSRRGRPLAARAPRS